MIDWNQIDGYRKISIRKRTASSTYICTPLTLNISTALLPKERSSHADLITYLLTYLVLCRCRLECNGYA
jgi:hypothetical protein